MPRVLPLIVGMWLVGCAPSIYVQPPENEPHALVTVRVMHHEASGPNLNHITTLNGYDLAVTRPTAVAGAPLTRSVRVRPEPLRWRFSSTFFHQVTETRMETVYQTESYSCGTETVGYGSSARTQTRTCTRQVPRQELRTHTRTVVDGACEEHLALAPRVGERYLVQFDYLTSGRCRARCFRQIAQPDGTFQLVPCQLR